MINPGEISGVGEMDVVGDISEVTNAEGVVYVSFCSLVV